VCTEREVELLSENLNAGLSAYGINVTACRNGQIHERKSSVTVIDIRQMKGLEFEATFFVEVDRFARVEPALFEEYFYVGITRAATYLGITCGQKLPEQLESLREHFADTW
jgi:superfamily I DNA/RNA helicase